MPFGAKDSHGSVARCNVPPEHSVIPGMTTDCHVVPPSKLTPATSPRDPPSDQRSCCQNATMLSGFVGFTSTHGSTSLFRNTVRWPDGSLAIWPATSSAVHVANGLGPETCTSAPVTNGPALSASGVRTIRVPMTKKGARLSLFLDAPVFMGISPCGRQCRDARRQPMSRANVFSAECGRVKALLRVIMGFAATEGFPQYARGIILCGKRAS